MNRQHACDAPMTLSFDPVVRAPGATRGAHGRSLPFLRWLERYFLATSHDRMRDDYLAYWH